MEQDMLFTFVIASFAAGVILCWIAAKIRINGINDSFRDTITDIKADSEKQLAKRQEEYGRLNSSFKATEKKLLTAQETLALKEQDETAVRNELDKTKQAVSELEEKVEQLTLKLEEEHKSKSNREQQLEKQLEDVLDLMRNKEQEFEKQLKDTQRKAKELSNEADQLKTTLMDEAARRGAAEEKVSRLLTLERQISDLSHQKSSLMLENAELKKTQSRLDKLEEIQDLYEKTLEENNFLKQQSLLKHFIEIKKCLDKTVHAYNKTCGAFDRKVLLSASDIIEEGIMTPVETKKLEISDNYKKDQLCESENVEPQEPEKEEKEQNEDSDSESLNEKSEDNHTEGES